jgi:hypothetical protein
MEKRPLVSCVFCEATLIGGPAGTCKTCAKENHGNGSLCTSCLADHSQKRGLRSHAFEMLLWTEDAFLAQRVLSPAAMTCPAHASNRIQLMCATPGCKSNRLCCSSCLRDAHKGHELVPIDDAARSVRKELSRAAYATTAGVSASVPAALTSLVDVPAAVKLTPVVIASQRGSKAVAERIDMLQRCSSATADDVEALCDAVIAAAQTLRSRLTSLLKLSLSAQQGQLQNEKAAWDDLHDRASAKASVALEASIILGPANAALHGFACIQELTRLRGEIEGMAQAKRNAGYIGVTAATSRLLRELVQAIRSAEDGAFTSREDACEVPRPAAAAAAATKPPPAVALAPRYYSHHAAPAGSVYAAATAGDAALVLRELKGGASTEEADKVSRQDKATRGLLGAGATLGSGGTSGFGVLMACDFCVVGRVESSFYVLLSGNTLSAHCWFGLWCVPSCRKGARAS